MSQQDTYDMKPDAPAEFRGPYRPIATHVPGMQITERFPRQAHGDGPALDRAVGASSERHPRSVGSLDADRLLRSDAGPQRPAEAVVRLGHRQAAERRQRRLCRLTSTFPRPRPLAIRGRSTWARRYNPFELGADPNAKNFRVPNLALPTGLSLDSLQARARCS